MKVPLKQEFGKNWCETRLHPCFFHFLALDLPLPLRRSVLRGPTITIFTFLLDLHMRSSDLLHANRDDLGKFMEALEAKEETKRNDAERAELEKDKRALQKCGKAHKTATDQVQDMLEKEKKVAETKRAKELEEYNQ